MNENEHDQQNWQDRNKDHHVHKPRWKRIHHSFIFWIFLLLMFAGITYYIMSVDFAFAPHRQLKQPLQNSRTP